MTSTATASTRTAAPTSTPTEAIALQAAAVDALREGRLGDAEAKLAASVRLVPHDAAVHDNHGLALAALGRFDAAEAAHRRAIALAPASPSAYNNLAALLRVLGRCPEALEACERAIALEPGIGAFHLNHGETLRALLRPQDAAAAYATAIRIKPDYADAYFALGQLWHETDNRNGARFALNAYLKLDPADRHGARALLAATDPAAPPPAQFSPAYVRNLFDGYAPRFEEHLLGKLQYCGHTLLRAAVDALDPAGTRRYDILDLGCGTGLAGAAFRPIAGRLTGIDISPAMIEHARARGIYDDLAVGDIVPELARRTDAFDLVLAADVFIYLGALDEVVPAIHRVLKPGGLAAFTIESDPDGPPYRLLPSRRFAQNPDHVERLARDAGFAVAARTDIVQRMEADVPIRGTLFVLRRAG